MEKIVITGVHLTPALSLIEELKKRKIAEIYFFGRKYAMEGSKSLSEEYKEITRQKIKFYPITTGRIQRKFTKYTFSSVLKIPIGLVQSFYYLLVTRPKLIVSFGGYLSLPVVFSGWLLGIKSVTHEQSIEPGFANKQNSLFVKKIFVSWADSLKFFPKEKSKVIGNLVRKSIFDRKAKNKKLESFIKNSKKLILVMGGNQGSHFLNRLIFKSLPRLNSFEIIHQVGSTNFKGDLDAAKKINRKNYLVVDYISAENIGAVLNRADLVISRSGANTVWDLAILAKVAILIPLPIAASNEQYKNAQILEKAGSAIVLDQKDLDAQILEQKIDYIFKSLPKFQKSAQTFSQTLPEDAARTLAREIESMLNLL